MALKHSLLLILPLLFSLFLSHPTSGHEQNFSSSSSSSSKQKELIFFQFLKMMLIIFSHGNTLELILWSKYHTRFKEKGSKQKNVLRKEETNGKLRYYVVGLFVSVSHVVLSN
ncbi:uncharacterized protein LOC103487443 isoform X3 [Cucumis melo]|uniref:Uncharacterized protein LOC103487443 isoform X3 n=1 Tax=Cucumis melo TaxID=3656 RepID=A0ABM3KIG9_CUCME|nr:uncharacterized protein LOC103487443 isoform X3 [Cucumis melo]